MTAFLRNLYNATLSDETRFWLYKLRHPKAIERKRTVVNTSEKGDFSLKAFDEHRCIFVHITKTAGTSVAKGLFGYLPYHYTATDYRVIYGRKTFDEYFKFAFVRNPWDRVYSAYRYLNAGGWNHEDENWRQKNIAHFTSFNHFVSHWLNADNIKKHVHFLPQYHFICDAGGRILIDYLAYFETINEDFDSIAGKLDIDACLSHHNASPADSYHDVYDDRSRAIVAQVYARDIELFGYEFDRIATRTVL